MNTYLKLLTQGTDIAVVSTDTCIYCGEEFPLYDLEKKLLDSQEFKYPDSCPLCNFKLLSSYLNDKHLYHRKDLDDNPIIATVSEEYPGRVMEAKAYQQFLVDDGALEFGQEIGENPYEDFKKMYQSFPKPSRLIYPSLENADYASHCGWSKNLYLSYCVFIDCEDIYYSFRVLGNCKNIFRSYNITESCNNIYASSVVAKSYNIFFSDNIVSSHDVLFCKDMNTCQDCIFSCNQVNARYMVFNTRYTKEEYLSIKKDILGRLQDYKQAQFLQKKYQEFLQKNFFESGINMNRTEKSFGEAAFDSKNCVNVFCCNGSEKCINVLNAGDDGKDMNKNIINSTEEGANAENMIGITSVGVNTFNIFFSYTVTESSNIYYCIDVERCKECMFCVGLRGKQYYIFNKQYKKEEYFQKKEKIIERLKKTGDWGRFLDLDFSKYPYNDTLSYDYFKVHSVISSSGEKQIIDTNAIGVVTLQAQGFIVPAILDLGGNQKLDILWRTQEREVGIPKNTEFIRAKDLPKVQDTNEDICERVVLCSETQRPFRIAKQELDFLRKYGLPLPDTHYEVFIQKLIDRRPIGQLYVTKSDESGEEMLSVYKQKPSWKVISHGEYQKKMYG